MSRKGHVILYLSHIFVRDMCVRKKRNSLEDDEREEIMCISCGCGNAYDDHGDSRNITVLDLDQAAQAAGTTREHVLQNIIEGGKVISMPPSQQAQAGRGDYYQSSLEHQQASAEMQPDLEKESGRQPGEVSPELGQDSGTAWQEGLQMGDTGRGGVQNPQTNP